MIAEWIIGKFNQNLKDRSSIKIVQWAFHCVLLRILRIGERLDKSEEFRRLPRHEIQTIDAEGYIVAPGLISRYVPHSWQNDV